MKNVIDKAKTNKVISNNEEVKILSSLTPVPQKSISENVQKKFDEKNQEIGDSNLSQRKYLEQYKLVLLICAVLWLWLSSNA